MKQRKIHVLAKITAVDLDTGETETATINVDPKLFIMAETAEMVSVGMHTNFLRKEYQRISNFIRREV